MTTVQQQSYDDLLTEAKSVVRGTATTYIPRLCRAVKDENPHYSNDQIRHKIIADCRHIWVQSTIVFNLPDWLTNRSKEVLRSDLIVNQRPFMKKIREKYPQEPFRYKRQLDEEDLVINENTHPKRLDPKIQIKSEIDWCHLCGTRTSPLAEFIVPQNAENKIIEPSRGYFRFCHICIKDMYKLTDRSDLVNYGMIKK